MRDPVGVLGWKVAGPARLFVDGGLAVLLGVFVGVGPLGFGLGLFVGLAVSQAVTDWAPSPWLRREASEEFLLVSGAVTRRGLALRRCARGLANIAAALGIAACFRIAGQAGPEALESLASTGIAAVDAYLFTAVLYRGSTPSLRLLRAAVAAGIVLLVAYPALASRARAASLTFWILTLAGAPLALAALLRDRIDIRSAAAGSRPGRREATLGRFGRGSGPLPALVRTTLLPLFGREPTATVCFALVCVVVFGFLRSAGSALAPLEVFSPASVPLCLSLAMVAGVPWFSWAAKPDESLEHLLSQPLSRPLLAAGIGAALHFALCAFAGIGFAANLALARAFGSPEPSLVAAAAWLLLASAQVGISSAGLCRVLGTQSGRAFVAMLLSVLALPALVALPAIERGLRGDSALLSSWIRAEGAPWLAAHAPLALGALFVSAALAQALAYRRFRSLGL